MASGAQSLRFCLRSRSRAPALRLLRPQPARIDRLGRSLSTTTPARREAANDDQDSGEYEFDRVYNNPGDVVNDLVRTGNATPDEEAQLRRLQERWAELPHQKKQAYQRGVHQLRQELGPLRRRVKARNGTFWNEDEKDPDLITNEMGEDDFEEDDILSMGHGKLEEHREHREYARIAIWEMPLLAKFAKPFEPPNPGEALRFRYTTYMGEFHPAEKKVVVEFSPRDLGLSSAQQLKLAKLAGPRYNPETRIVRMSCEMFEHQAQNKRYLGDLVDKMIAEAKNPADMFDDIPLDTRHHTFKTKPKFPKEWRLTDKRKEELEALRQQAFQLDQAKRSEGALVDGRERIQHALSPPEAETQDRVAELAAIPARSRGGPGARRW